MHSTVTSQLEIYAKRLGDECEWLCATRDVLFMPAIAAVEAGSLARSRWMLLEAIQGLLMRGPEVIAPACTEIPVVVAIARTMHTKSLAAHDPTTCSLAPPTGCSV